MARNTKLLVITAEGRDKGKGYFLTEMRPDKTEKWAYRLLLGISQSGDGKLLPDGFRFDVASSAQLVGLTLTMLMKVRWEVAEPLLDEMMSCVQYQPRPDNDASRLPLSAVPEAIEDVQT